MSREAAGQYQDMVRAVLKEVELLGPAGLNKSAIVELFVTKGVSRTTAYRWIGEILASGRPAAHLATKVEEAAAERLSVREPPAAAPARERSLPLPRPADVGKALAPEHSGSIAFMDLLRSCLSDAQDILAYARTDDGKIRNPRLILMASQHLRQTLETAAKIQQAVVRLSQIDEFHEAIIAEIAASDPEVAERLVQRLRWLMSRWAPRSEGGTHPRKQERVVRA